MATQLKLISLRFFFWKNTHKKLIALMLSKNSIRSKEDTAFIYPQTDAVPLQHERCSSECFQIWVPLQLHIYSKYTRVWEMGVLEYRLLIFFNKLLAPVKFIKPIHKYSQSLSVYIHMYTHIYMHIHTYVYIYSRTQTGEPKLLPFAQYLAICFACLFFCFRQK